MATKRVANNHIDHNMPANENPRVIHLEGRVERLENDVTEIKTGVQKLLDRPQNPGFTQVIVTLFSTLGAIGMIFTFAQWQLSTAMEPQRAQIVAISGVMKEFDGALRAAQMEIATMREREAWLKEQAGGKQ